MNEKRFTLLDETIFDNEKQAEDGGRVTYWVVSYGQRQRLVGLLNEQQSIIQSLEEENEQLKSERRNDAKEFSALFKQNLRLKRENDKLKKKLSECQGHKLELTPIPISNSITLKEAEDSIRITKYEELFDDE